MRQLHISSFSLPGGRAVNEDSVRTAAENGRRLIGVVADGLGGQGSGDVASRIASERMLEILLSLSKITADTVTEAMEKINAAILAEQFAGSCKMMSTLAAAVIDGRRILLAHLGDTRIYRFRNGRLIYCSHDHSVTQSLADAGEITREEMRFHESRNLVLNCLGQMDILKPEIKTGFFWGNEKILICSDGFWEKFSDAELEQAMKHQNPDRILDMLKNSALRQVGEGSDNISAVLIG